MQLVVNGEPHELKEADTLPALLKDRAVNPERVGVLVNDEVVPAAARASFRLHPGDRVELLTFAGGG